MKKSSDTIGNRTRDLPACSTVPKTTAPPRAPAELYTLYICNGFCINAIYFSFPYQVSCEVADSGVFFGAELYTLSNVNPEVSAEAAARYLPEWF